MTAARISIALLAIVIIIAVGALTGCSKDGVGDMVKGSFVSERTIEEVLEDKTDQWMAIPGVEGTAIGLFEGAPCIMILSSAVPKELRAQIPETLEGYNVVIRQTGTFRARDGQ